MARTATADLLPPNVAAGAVMVEVAMAAAGAADAPEWIKIAPRGAVSTRDGRAYSFDPEALVARFAADGVDLVVDFDHAVAMRGSKGERTDAQGWIRELAARADGLWGRVDWLAGGKAALAGRTHRYVSPTFHHDSDGRATWLHSVSLVTAPALGRMPALAHASTEKTMKTLAKALGLAETADEPACLAAVEALKAAAAPKAIAAALGLAESSDAAACLAAIGTLKAGAGVKDETQATLAATRQELATLKADLRKKEVDGLLDEALKAKKILPAQREQYAKLCATDEGLKEIGALLAATPENLRSSGLDELQPPTGAVDPAKLAAEATKYQQERQAAGQPISYGEAVGIVSEGKHK